MIRLHPISEAPKDGTVIRGIYSEDTSSGVNMRWEQDRYCMIGSPQGYCGPGWFDVDEKLPLEEPSFFTEATQ